MNSYETLYIVHPALESGRLKEIIISLEENLKNAGGKTLSINILGKKRLAYLIEKQKYGTYVQIQFSGKGDCTKHFEIELEHDPNILSYLTTIIEKDDIVEQEKDLETQIAGQSRTTKEIVHVDESKKELIKKSDEPVGKDNPTTEDVTDDDSNELKGDNNKGLKETAVSEGE